MIINTDIAIIGAGPAGLFTVFEAGLLKMRCHVIDALPQIGGQLSEIYPPKPIYDIPGYPVINAIQLIDKLTEQIAPFHPGFTLGERVEILAEHDGTFKLTTNEQKKINCKAVIIAGGLGSFEPRKPNIDNLSHYEGKGVLYMIKNPELLRDRNVVIAGGGDSAIDWTIMLAEIASRVTLVHRGDTFRGSPEGANKIFQLAEADKLNLFMNSHVIGLNGEGHLQGVQLVSNDGHSMSIKADAFIPLFGLSPKLGPVANWGLNVNNSSIGVNVEDYSTNVKGIYAVGDIATYPGKLKLILSGFHEAALAVQSAFKLVYPQERLTFKYTTVYGINGF
jgi:thioredoxin reductase (NADPH)